MSGNARYLIPQPQISHSKVPPTMSTLHEAHSIKLRMHVFSFQKTTVHWVNPATENSTGATH